MKDAQGALDDFKAAISLSPYSAHMYLNRGNLYASMQQFDKAEKDFTRGEICCPVFDGFVVKNKPQTL